MLCSFNASPLFVMKIKKIHLRHNNQKIEENEKQLHSKVSKVTYNEFEKTLERDPGKRPQIW